MSLSRAQQQIRKAFLGHLAKKQDTPILIPGLLGTYSGGSAVVQVPNRPDYVYVRLRGVQSELVEALNRSVLRSFNLPVLVIREGGHWRVYDVNEAGMSTGGSGQAFLPNHGAQHSFSGGTGSAQGDITWVFKRQFMPLLTRPTAPNSMGVYVESDYFALGGSFVWFAGTGTPQFTSLVPVVSNQALFVTVYLDHNGNLDYITGTSFAYTGSVSDPDGLVPMPAVGDGIPLSSIFIYNTQTKVGWPDIWDVRTVVQDPTAGVAAAGWALVGNLGTVAGTNFVGTRDAQDLVVKTNNAEVARFYNGGGFSVGSLTADTVVYADASKKLVSLANAAGVLTNNGVGVLSWGAGGGIPALTATYIGYGDAGNLLTGSANLTWDATRLTAQISDAATNTVVYPLRVSHITSGMAAALFGAGIDFQLENAGGNNVVAGMIEAVWKTPTNAAEVGQLVFRTLQAGTLFPAIIVTGGTTTEVGNARGLGSIEIQAGRALAAEVASGSASVLIATRGEASGASSLAIGYFPVASGPQAIAIGKGTSSGNGSILIAPSHPTGSSTVSGDTSVAIGILHNVSGDKSVGIGQRAVITHDGSFLYADQTAADFNSVAADEFALRARGGLRHAYDDAYYWTANVSNAGVTTFATLPVGAGFVFTPPVTFNAAQTINTTTIPQLALTNPTGPASLTVSVAATTGAVTLDAAGTAPSFSFTDPVTVKGTTATDSPTFNVEFLSASGWTSVDWTGDWATGWTHDVGNTTALSQSTAAENTTKYQIAYTVSGPAGGSFTIAFGGQSLAGITATGTFGPTTTSTANLVITPTSDFVGTIVISIKKITAASTAVFVLTSSDSVTKFELLASSATAGNTFVGAGCGRYNTTGIRNTVLGYQSLYNSTTGDYNVAVGYQALNASTVGAGNFGLGYRALYSSVACSNNTAIGGSGLFYLTSGDCNVALGVSAGRYRGAGSNTLTTANNAVLIGYNVRASANGNTNEIVIGANAIGAGGNTVTLGHTDIVQTLLNGATSITGRSDAKQLLVTGFTTQAVATPLVGFTRADAAAGISQMLGLTALGSGANGDGGSIVMAGKSSTTAATLMGLDQWLYVIATHASYTTRRIWSAYDSGGVREGFRLETNGAAAMLGFYGGAAVVRGAALTAQLTTITHTAPGTPDYALQDLVQNTGFGFVTKDEGNSTLAVIANLQVRIAQLEARLDSATGVNLFA